MQHRNLKRHLLTSKVLHRYNKSAPFEVTVKRLQILTCIHLMQDAGINTTMRNIRTSLSETGIFSDWLNLLKQITDIMDANLIAKKDNLYILTVEGRYILQQLENKLRNARFNR